MELSLPIRKGLRPCNIQVDALMARPMRIVLPMLATSFGTIAIAAAPTPVASPLPLVQSADAAGPAQSDPSEADIVVTAQRVRGGVVTDVPPVIELDEKAIESYGAASITELLSALSPQTGSGRGRGSGGPVVLLNGQRISGFSELRDLPPEAILRVQVLPEEVALQYGFSPDQRVVNFILKENFRAVTVDVENGFSTAGARLESELQGSLVRIGKLGRVTLGTQYNRETRVLESDRGIIQRAPVFPVDDAGAYRTLLPATDSLKLNAVVNRKVTDTVAATINTSWQRDTSNTLLGLPTASIVIPAGQSFSPVGAPSTLVRGYLPGLTGSSATEAAHGGLTVNGNAGGYNWTLTGNYDRSIVNSRTDRGVDAVALQALVSAPGSSFNPYPAVATGVVPFLPRDTARTQTDTSNGLYTVTGPVLQLPAGPLRATLRAGFATTRLNGRSFRSGGTTLTRLARNEGNGRVNVEIPLANAARGIAAPLGKLSINGNISYRRLSDVGGLTSFGYGLNWQPTEGVTFLASTIGSENEPGIAELGNPVVLTPGVPTYDFNTGTTVLANRLNGGNPALVTEVQRDTKLGLEFQPTHLKGLGINIDYFRNRSRNPVAGFPTLNPAIEAAFLGRVTRDAAGRLISIDARPVNFASTASDVVRVGFTFQKSFGQTAGGRGFGGPGGPGGRGPGGGGPGGGAGPGGGGPRGGFGGFGNGGRPGDGGRWSVALYDSIRFRDQIQIRPGLPLLDLLGGNATGSSGGAPRHSFDLDAGWFNKGVGFRLTGSYLSGSTVVGTTTASTLQFGDLATLNANVFFNFDSRKDLVQKVPILKGVRVRFLVQNIANTIRDVRDGTGAVPLGYQPGYVDPRGRFVRLDIRKRF